MGFDLAACAEMLWLDKPMDWRVRALDERGFGVGLWNWNNYDLVAMEKTGARFSIMNGYLEGRLADKEGADILLDSARDAVQVGKRLGVERLNLHGTGLGEGGIPRSQHQVISGEMWLTARDTLHRVCDMAEKEGVNFTLENLNLMEHPGCPFNTTGDVLALVAEVNRPQLRINLDLYHTQVGEGDVLRWTERCLPYIGEIQIADNPGRCEPGTGEMNYPVIAQKLSELGYRGPVAMEGFAKEDPEAALHAFRDAFTI